MQIWYLSHIFICNVFFDQGQRLVFKVVFWAQENRI